MKVTFSASVLYKFFAALLIVMLAVAGLPIQQAKAATVGANSPTTAAGWTNSNNALTSNTVYATFTGASQAYLVLGGYGFSIPAGSTINGFQVNVKGLSSGTNVANRTIQVGLTKNGTAVFGTAKTQALNNADATFALGTTADLWGGASWLSTDTNAATFGVMIRDNDATSSGTFSIDYVSVTITYTPPTTTVGVATAVAAGATSINVSMPYTDDANANNTYTVEYKLSADSTWTTWVSGAAHTVSPYTTSILGLTTGSSYDVRVIYNDTDGVTGTNPQTITNITLAIPACTTSYTYSAPAGTDRVVVVAISAEGGASPTAVQIGGVNATAITTVANGNARIYTGYRVIGTSAVPQAMNVTATNGTCFYANTYQNINQTAGTGASNTINSIATGTAASGTTVTNTSVFNATGGAVTNVAGGRVVYAINMNNGAADNQVETGTATAWTFSELFDKFEAGGGNRTAVGESSSTVAGSSAVSVGDGGVAHNRSVLVAFALNSSNSAPTDVALSAAAINENVAANSTVGNLSSTDPDAGNTFTYTLVAGAGSTDNASFNISGSALRITNSPDFETKNSYSVRVRTTDQGGLFFEKAFTITINDLNESPTDIALSATAINENVAANSTVGTLSSTDPDAGNTFTYTLVAGAGSTDNASFNISGSALRITNSPDFETKSSYSVRVRTTDQGGLFFEKAFTITINDLNESPTDIALSATAINENVAANSTVGNLSSTDPDAGNTFTYTLVAGAGSTDNASFNISGSALRITNSPDFETKNSYSVRVRTTDQGGLFFEKAFTITINDLDEIPPDTTINSNPTNPSNTGSAAFTFSGTDASGIASFECALDGGGFAACTSPQSYLGLGDGSHTFQVRAIDTAGNVDASPASYTWVVDATAPDTSITANPADPTASTSASFSFTGTDGSGSGVASFECALDGGGFAACTSPQSYLGLGGGSHTFDVRAIDNAGNVDASPASYTWVVDAAAPDTSITANPTDPTASTSASFSFTGTDGSGSGVASFECALDGGGFSACTSPQSYLGLGDGSHTFQVRAIDNAGNADASPASFTWTVDTAAPTVTLDQAGGQSDPTNASPINFTVVFSEDVSGFDETDITLGGTAGATTAVVTGGPTTYNVAVSGMTGAGTVTADVNVNAATDSAGNASAASTSTDNQVTYDATAPTVTIDQAGGQSDPTNASPINFTVVFSEAVSGFDETDITLGGTAGATTAVVTGGPATYNVAVSGMTGDGTVTADVNVNAATDSAGNTSAASTSTDNTVAYSTAALTVTIDQAVAQIDPTNLSPINFTVVFSAATTNFVTGDVTLSGTAGATTAVVTGGPTTYNVAVSGMTGNGTVIATIAASVATDAASNSNAASTSTDNTVTYDQVNPTVAGTDLIASYTGTGPSSFIATFSKDVNDPAGNLGKDDVTNPVNYLLVNKGANGIANTASCAGGVVTDDTQVTVSSVSYNNTNFKATVTLAAPLPVGSYRLFICGTTSIVDLAGNHLNGGSDYVFDLTVAQAPQQGGGNGNNIQSSVVKSTLLPATGFPQDKVTKLPVQPADKAYASTDLWLEIPKLGVKMPIVGVPSSKTGWDVTWLDKSAGWLNGSAFPTWDGNSVLTGHVWDALNRAGPFAQLKSLKYGDQIKIHVYGQVYTFEITESAVVYPSGTTTVFKHSDKPVITLVTCEDYKEQSNTYLSRRMVRAALVSVTKEK